MIPKKLIVNADDFGLTKGVNLGIIEAFINGIVKSTTIMANQEAFDHAVGLAKTNNGLGVGVHLTLTSGVPLTKGLNTIVDEKGCFLKQGVLFSSTLDQNEIETEFTAQIQKVIKSGIKITHLDSHHHVHLDNKVSPVVKHIAKKYDLPVRSFNCDFSDKFYNDGATVENLISIIDQNNENFEIMTHPAYLDRELYILTSYALKRIEELHILTCNEIKSFIEDRKINLCNFGALY